ncbi:MAG: putative glycosyltransferase [Bacteroidia bacterium]|nr:putative glycosyltransferase [Bacteroidia bacterium]
MKISFVIPCFNNEENIDDLFEALLENEKQFTNTEFEYVMVDDASDDKTFYVLSNWKTKESEKIKLVQLKENIGSHKAVSSGLNNVTGDCVVVMAADLQDPPQLSKTFFEEWKKGNKLVLGIKDNTLSISSKLFHWVMKNCFVKSSPQGAFDYALFDKSLIVELQKKSIKNCNLFYRLVDIYPHYSTVNYTKQSRKKGKSGWSFSKKLLFFIENIFAYSLAKMGILK